MESECFKVNCPKCGTEVLFDNPPVQRFTCECNCYFRVIERTEAISQSDCLTAEEFHFGKSKRVEKVTKIEIMEMVRPDGTIG